MTRYVRPIVLTTFAAAALSLASPALAQRGNGGGRGNAQQAQNNDRRGGGEDRRGEARARGAAVQAPREQAQRPSAPAQAQRQQQVQPQAQQPRQQVEPQRQQAQRQQQAQWPPQVQRQQQAPAQVVRPEQQSRGTAVPRATAPQQRGYNAPPQRNGSQGYQQGYYNTYRGPTYYPARPYVARRPVFVQPYYAFRPRFTLSFGFHVGYGIAYPWTYWDPYAFYNYGIGVRPGYQVRNYYDRVGGVSFDIDPWDASIFVDSQYVGCSADFGPNQMPLTLTAGRHRVDVRSEGYRSVSFDITVVAGQVIPYQGTLPYDW